MKIRHLLEPNGAKVAFACGHEPYVREFPILYWALVTQHRTNPDTGETVAEDKVVGMISNGTIVSAEDPQPNGFVFGAYLIPGQFSDEETTALRNQLRAWGYNLSRVSDDEGNTDE